MSEHLAEEELALLALSPEATPSIAAVQHLEACDACRARVHGVQRTARVVGNALHTSRAPVALDHVHAQLSRELQLGGHAPRDASSARDAEPARLPAPRTLPGSRLSGIRALFPIAASALLAWMAGQGDALAAREGLQCAAVELGSAALMLTGLVLLARRTRVALPSTMLASVAGTGALLAHVWLHSHCEAHSETPHLFVFHVGSVILAASLAPLARKLVPSPGAA